MSRARYWQWHCHAWPLLTLRFGGVYGLQSHTVEGRDGFPFFVSRSRFSKTFVNCHDVNCHFRSTCPDSTLVITSRRVARPTLLQLHVAPHVHGQAGLRRTRRLARVRVPPRRARRESASDAPTSTSRSSSLVLVPESRVKYEVCGVPSGVPRPRVAECSWTWRSSKTVRS